MAATLGLQAVAIRDPAAFIRANTEVLRPPLVPEIALHLASEVVPLWQATEEELAASGLPPPFWAFAWAGGQGLARYLLDHPAVVSGRCVLDFGCGGGVQGLAAAMARAARVEAVDIDPFARAAAALNAETNGVALDILSLDPLAAAPDPRWQVILAGDVCYEGPAAKKIEVWLRQAAAAGACVLVGDPGRTYLPRQGLDRLIAYSVKTSRELEDSDLRNAVVWRLVDG